MKKQLLSEVKHFQKIAGLLKESFDRDAPESNTYEDVRDWLDNLYPDTSQYPDFLTDFKKELQFLTPEERNEWITKFKRDFGEDLNESWHPDDPANVDLDGIEDADPDDYDDISEDDSEAYSESGNTDAMGGIDEAGNIKGIKIEIPGNSYASDFGKVAAREVIGSFGTPGFREFLQGFTEEIAKLTNRS